MSGNNSRKYTKVQIAIIRRKKAEEAAKKKAEEERIEAPYPHFRYYKKSKHPALIIGEQKTVQDEEEYKYRKVMHGVKDGKRNNEKVYPNPKPGDTKPMYIGKRVRHDVKENFEPRPLPWKYPKKDK